MTKEKLDLVLGIVLDGLDISNVKGGSSHYGYYNSLYNIGDEQFSEHDIANAISEYPELHPQMIEIVERITNAIRLNKVFDMWADDETQAGNIIAHSLAMYDKKYCTVYAKSLLEQDLDHEANQNSEIIELVEKWGCCDETAVVISARIENYGQHGGELLEDLFEEYGSDLAKIMKKYIDLYMEIDHYTALNLATSLALADKTDIPLLTKCTVFFGDDHEYDCDLDAVFFALFDLWEKWGFCKEICDLIVACLLQCEEGYYVLCSNLSLEKQEIPFSHVMKDESASNAFLSSIASWLNSDLYTAKHLCESLKNGDETYFFDSLKKAFEVAFKQEEDSAENSVQSFLKLFSEGKIPTYAQIVQN